MTKDIKTFTFFDAIIILLLLCSSVFFYLQISTNGNSTVLVFFDDQIYGRYELNKDQKVAIKGKIGEAILKIENGSAELIESPCPHQICVKTGKIKNPSNQIVCAPGHIMIRISTKKTENEVDAVAQ